MAHELLRVISLGAGVQSSTLALMASRGMLDHIPEVCIFADTGNEPASVYEWLAFLERELHSDKPECRRSLPVLRVKSSRGSGNLGEESLVQRTTKDGERVYWKGYVPYFTVNPSGTHGMLNRKCTGDFKIAPLTKATRALVKKKDRRLYNDWMAEYRRRMIEWLIRKEGSRWEDVLSPKRKRGIRAAFLSERHLHPAPLVEQWLGITVDEAHRMKPAREPWILNRYPLVEMGFSRGDCLKWMERSGYPRPPRSACTFCPYHSDAEWLRLKREEPAAFREAVEFERRSQELAATCKTSLGVPYLHASRRPLDRVYFDEDRQGTLFGEECEGMCGL